MTRTIVLGALLLFTAQLLLADAEMRVIHDSENFVVFAEDSRDYTVLISSLEADNVEFQTLFGRRLAQRVRVYIYRDQKSFNLSMFGSETPFIDTLGAAYWGDNQMHLVSPYGTNRDPSFVRTIPRHELIHLYLPFNVTWIGEGSAWYWARQLRPLDTLPIPNSSEDLVFWWETKRQTLHAYNCSGWLIRFIYEELLNRDMLAFRRFFASPSDYALIGVESEEDLFARWQHYMKRFQESDRIETWCRAVVSRSVTSAAGRVP